MRVTLLGSAGSKPVPYRNLTSCFIVDNNSRKDAILIDCGEGNQVALSESSCNPLAVGIILITHCHLDHVLGIPGLLSSMNSEDRTDPLIIIGPQGIKKQVDMFVSLAGILQFPVECIELKEDFEQFENNVFKIQAFKVDHSILCYGYSIIQTTAGSCNVAEAEKSGIDMQYWSALQVGFEFRGANGIVTRERVYGKDQPMTKLVYSTDTRPCQSLQENLVGANLAILEGMYPGEDEKTAIAKKHMTVQEAIQLAQEASVPTVWLTHFASRFSAVDQYKEDLHLTEPIIKMGKTGMYTQLN